MTVASPSRAHRRLPSFLTAGPQTKVSTRQLVDRLRSGEVEEEVEEGSEGVVVVDGVKEDAEREANEQLRSGRCSWNCEQGERSTKAFGLTVGGREEGFVG